MLPSEVYNQSTFLTVKAAYLYYIKGFSQNQIAKHLNISISTVSRLISKAKEEKIIEFVIKDPFLECIELEHALKDKFLLKDIIVAPNPIEEKMEEKYQDDVDSEKQLVALEGARYLQRIIKDDDVLGIAFGKTMYHMIHYLNPCQKVRAQFVTLHGSISFLQHDLDVIPLSRRLAMAFGGENKFIHAEGLVSNSNLAKELRKEKNTKNIFELFDRVTIAIIGIGSFYPIQDSKLSHGEFMTPDELHALQEKDVIGDVALRFFNNQGEECDTEMRERTIGITFEQFKRIPTKIAMVSGAHKTYSVLSALKGGLIDVLIVNYALGKALLENS
ncbi:MAG: sugar-binding transcriptional regulator [Eubacteriales bacterium]